MEERKLHDPLHALMHVDAYVLMHMYKQPVHIMYDRHQGLYAKNCMGDNGRGSRGNKR